MLTKTRIIRPSAGEEIANSLTHGLGAVLAMGGLAVLVTLAALHGDAWHLFVLAGTVLHIFAVLLYVVP